MNRMTAAATTRIASTAAETHQREVRASEFSEAVAEEEEEDRSCDTPSGAGKLGAGKGVLVLGGTALIRLVKLGSSCGAVRDCSAEAAGVGVCGGGGRDPDACCC